MKELHSIYTKKGSSKQEALYELIAKEVFD